MIRLENLTKVFPNQDEPAVDDLSMDIYEGEIVVLVGPSGCGKTTTMKMINRLIEPSSGRIFLQGEDVTNVNSDKLRRRIGYVIQQIGLFPHMTIADNIATVPKMLGWDKKRISDRTDELLETVGIDLPYRDRYPKELSGGQRHCRGGSAGPRGGLDHRRHRPWQRPPTPQGSAPGQRGPPRPAGQGVEPPRRRGRGSLIGDTSALHVKLTGPCRIIPNPQLGNSTPPSTARSKGTCALMRPHAPFGPRMPPSTSASPWASWSPALKRTLSSPSRRLATSGSRLRLAEQAPPWPGRQRPPDWPSTSPRCAGRWR